MTHDKLEKAEFRSRDRWLLYAFLAGPLSVLFGQLIAYSFVPSACEGGSKTALHLTFAAFLLIALSGAAVAGKYYREYPPDAGVLWRERARWVATVAMVLSLGSAMVIVAMEIPNLLLRSCS